MTIQNLTKEQQALLPVYRDKWLGIGLDTTPVDRVEVVDSVYNLYKEKGFARPEVIFLDEFLDERNKQQNLEVGQFSAYWLSFYDYFNEVFGLVPEVKPLIRVAKAGGVYNLSGNKVYHVDRPEVIKMADGRLHCEDGPSVRFKCGFSVYSWRGTRVPKEWIIDKDNLDPSIALTWENVEQRRCAAEIIGWSKVLGQLNAKTIDEDDPYIGTLVEADIPEIGKERFLRILCGTKREFAMPVPPNVSTALEAQAFLHGEDLSTFKLPEVRT